MKEREINVGDLVCIDDTVKVPGALTAVKFVARLINEHGEKTGIVTVDHGTHVIVVFGNCTRNLIHKRFLRIVEVCQ